MNAVATRKPLGPISPFYAQPLTLFRQQVELLATSVRTLKNEQLASELEQLWAIPSEQAGDLAVRLLVRIFEVETARRGDPALRLDDQLDAALSRLERSTNEDDRQLVWMIGTDLFAVGGFEAMRAAERRMLAAVKPDRQSLRQRILEKRWAGIGAQGVSRAR
ncbi:hypothetical protein ABIB57_003650 [Devosia sp. UYZn731]|uniref:hypothetical protein n=1 Tax=Devosia sp. UYZn731 TaxID=3156345 RepID=UPI003393A138